MAENYFLKSLVIARTTQNNNWTATAYSGLGETKLKMSKVTEASQLFRKSLALRQEITDLTGISESYFLLSQVDTARNQYDSALLKLRLSQHIAKNIGSKNRQLENFSLYKSLFINKRQFDSALYYQDLFHNLKDSLFNENLARELSGIESKITEEEHNALLVTQQAQLQRREEQISFLSAILIFLVILGLITFYHYRREKKLSNDLISKNIEIHNQKEEITQQQDALLLNHEELVAAKEQIHEQNEMLVKLNKKLQATVDLRTQELQTVNQELKYASLELDNFVYRSSHDLRGPLVRLIGVCQVALMDVKDPKAREYLTLLYDTSQHLNELFDRLRFVSEINSIDIQQNISPISFTNIITKVKSRLEKIDAYEHVRFIEKIDQDIKFESNELLIETIFFGLMENAVRFQKKSDDKDKFVKVRIKIRPGKLIIIFSDNGIGIKDSQVEYIFQMFTEAAREKKTVGLGLYIVKQAVEKLKGTIGLAKSKSGFTRFKVVLPLP